MSKRHQPAYYEMLLRVEDDDGLVHTPDVILHSTPTDKTLDELDEWVLRTTIQWLNENPSKAASVNITPATMRSGSAIRAARIALEEFEVASERLMLEVPELSVTIDPEAFKVCATEVEELGMRIAIDDLGSDWRALATIRDVGVDAVKIDGYWVTRAVDDEIAQITIQSIVNAARLIGAPIVAEWIEDEETFELISGLGIEYGQGWLFGHPVRLDQVAS